MENLGHGHIIFIALITFIVLIFASSSGAGLKHGLLVVRSFYISQSPRADGVYLELILRQPGVFAWLLTKLKIEPTLELRMTYSNFEYIRKSVFGYDRSIVPVDSISSAVCSSGRPWVTLVMFVALGSLLGGWLAAHEQLLLGIAAAVLLIALGIVTFILGRWRKITISAVTSDRYPASFKRSVIEGQEVAEPQLDEIAKILVALKEARRSENA